MATRAQLSAEALELRSQVSEAERSKQMLVEAQQATGSASFGSNGFAGTSEGNHLVFLLK